MLAVISHGDRQPLGGRLFEHPTDKVIAGTMVRDRSDDDEDKTGDEIDDTVTGQLKEQLFVDQVDLQQACFERRQKAQATQP